MLKKDFGFSKIMTAYTFSFRKSENKSKMIQRKTEDHTSWIERNNALKIRPSQNSALGKENRERTLLKNLTK